MAEAKRKWDAYAVFDEGGVAGIAHAAALKTASEQYKVRGYFGGEHCRSHCCGRNDSGRNDRCSPKHSAEITGRTRKTRDPASANPSGPLCRDAFTNACKVAEVEVGSRTGPRHSGLHRSAVDLFLAPPRARLAIGSNDQVWLSVARNRSRWRSSGSHDSYVFQLVARSCS
jgi:hypothetical protein